MRSIARDVRIAFASFALALTVYAGLEAAAAPARVTPLSTCGGRFNPCELEALTVTATRPAVQVARQAAPAAAVIETAAPAPVASVAGVVAKS